jgi:hypothetical protein
LLPQSVLVREFLQGNEAKQVENKAEDWLVLVVLNLRGLESFVHMLLKLMELHLFSQLFIHGRVSHRLRVLALSLGVLDHLNNIVAFAY